MSRIDIVPFNDDANQNGNKVKRDPGDSAEECYPSFIFHTDGRFRVCGDPHKFSSHIRCQFGTVTSIVQ